MMFTAREREQLISIINYRLNRHMNRDDADRLKRTRAKLFDMICLPDDFENAPIEQGYGKPAAPKYDSEFARHELGELRAIIRKQSEEIDKLRRNLKNEQEVNLNRVLNFDNQIAKLEEKVTRHFEGMDILNRELKTEINNRQERSQALWRETDKIWKFIDGLYKFAMKFGYKQDYNDEQ